MTNRRIAVFIIRRNRVQTAASRRQACDPDPSGPHPIASKVHSELARACFACRRNHRLRTR